jgi:hypothetical protein
MQLFLPGFPPSSFSATHFNATRSLFLLLSSVSFISRRLRQLKDNLSRLQRPLFVQIFSFLFSRRFCRVIHFEEGGGQGGQIYSSV